MSDQPRRRLRLLLADDAREIRTVLRQHLTLQDEFDVVAEAGDGAEAVRLAASHQPDAVLLDMAMPVMDGLEAIPGIRQAAPSARIAVLSGFEDRSLSVEALAAGADLYLEKGVGLDELTFALSTLCHLPRSESAPLLGSGVPATGDKVRPWHDVAASFGHELRTPMTVISYLVWRMKDSAAAGALDRSTVLENLDAIQRNMDHLSDLVSSFTDASALEAGTLSLSVQQTDLAALAKETVSDLSPITGPHPVTVDSEGPAAAEVDPIRIRQVLINLVSNAAKFTPSERPIEVAVRTGEDTVAISVRDHGPGIPPARVSETLQKFVQLAPGTRGLGLGLYVSRGIVEAHGGELTIAGADGGGALVSFWVPVRAAAPPGSPARRTPPEATDRTPRTVRTPD